MIETSRKLESAKMDLSCNPDFNLMDAFTIFDQNGSGFVSPSDFYEAFVALRPTYFPKLNEVEDLFFKYNKTRDLKLKYSEFMNAMCPLTETYATMLR